MTRFHLNAVFIGFKWALCAIALYVFWGVAEHRGRLSGENGVGYWQGWQDAMTATDYGRKVYDSEKKPLSD